MSELEPRIEGHPASDYLRGVPDNNRCLIIVGDHPDKWDDVIDVLMKYGVSDHNADSMAVNKASLFWGISGRYLLKPFEYMATIESANCGTIPEFPEESIHPSTTVIGLRCGCESPRVDHTISAEPVGMTSAGFACIAGLVLGYKTMYLCGVRLEPGTIWHDSHVESNWKLWKPILQPHLTIMGKSWLRSMYEDSNI